MTRGDPLASLKKRRHNDLVQAVVAACNLVPGVTVFQVDVVRVPGWKRTQGTTGTPDVLGWKVERRDFGIGVVTRPRTVAFEIKIGRDTLRREQAAFLDALRADGGIAAEIRRVEDAVALLQ